MRRNYDDTDRAVNKLNRDVDGLNSGINAHATVTRRANSSTKEWTGSLEGLHSRLIGVNEAMAMYAPAAIQVARMAKSFKDLGGNQNTILNLTRSFFAVGGASTVFSIVRSRFLGMGKALGMAPVWQQQIVGMANSFRLLTFGLGILTKYEAIGKGWTRAAQEMVKVSQGAALGMLKFGDGVEKAAKPILPAINWIRQLNNSMDGMLKGAVDTVGGLALMRSGFSQLNRSFGIFGKNFQTGNYYMDLFIRGLKFVFLPGVILSSAAIQAFGKTLEFTSNLVAGLWDGIKQLSGGFLAIPGLLATIGTAVGTAAVIFSTLKNSLKSIGQAKGDIDKINQAIAAMPPYMRPLGQAIADLTPKWNDFKNTLTATFIQGAADQLRSLANGALPLVTAGAIQVANSFRNVKDSIVGWATQNNTISTMLNLFNNTAQIMNVLAGQTSNFGNALAMIANVGSNFIRDLAEDYLPAIGAGFNNWATVATSSGKAMEWMKGSVQGAKDLVKGLVDATKFTYALLTMFKTPTGGNNFLHNFAVEMDKLNNKVQASLSGGLLRKMGDDIRAMGTDKLKELRDLFRQMEPAIKAAYNILRDMSAAFGNMLPLIQLIVGGISLLIQGLNAIGAGTILGTILAITTSFGLMLKILSPLGAILKIVVGALAFKSGTESLILGIAGALEKFGPAGVKASGALLGIGDSVAGFIGKMAGVVALAVASFEAYQSGQKFIEDGNKEIADSSQHAADAVEKLRDAFSKDKAQVGANVVTQFRDNTKQAFNDIEQQGQKVPGILQNIGGWFDTAFGGKTTLQGNPFQKFLGTFFAQSDKFNQLQAKFQNSKAISDGIKELGVSMDQVSDAVTGGGPAIDEWSNKAQGMSGNAQAAANWMEELKRGFDNEANSAKEAGPAALQLSSAIKQLASAAGDSSSKLDALKSGLQALGLLKTDDFQAVADYAKSIRDLGDNAATAAGGISDFSNIIDPVTGQLNAATVGGGELLNVLRPVAENFLNLANKGHDTNQMFSDLQPQINKVAQDFHLLPDQITAVLQTLGVDPKIVNILVKLQGEDAIHQDMAKILLAAQTSVGQGVSVPVSIDTPENAAKLAADLNKLFNTQAATSSGKNLFLAPGISQAEVDAIAKKYGINANGPAPIPGLPQQTLPPLPAGGKEIPGAPAPAPPPAPKKGEPGYVAPTKPQQPDALPKSFAGLGIPSPLLPPQIPGTQTTPAPASAPTYTPPPDTPATPQPVVPATPAPTPGAAPPQTQQLSVAVTGLDQLQKAQGAVSDAAMAIQKAWQGMTDSIATGLVGATNAITAFVNNAETTLIKAGTAAQLAGTKFGQDFAAGIGSGASLTAIANAAAKAAQTAQNYMPQHSPAKEGPLSGDGWSGIAGKKFSTDFAGGVEDGVSNISGSVKKAAEAAKLIFGGLTKGVPEDKNYLKQFTDLTTLAANFQKSFSGAYNTGSKFLQFLSDPLKTGGFFGKALPYARDSKVSDDDLAQRRQKGDSGIGGDLLGGAASLAGVQSPSKEDIAAAIVGEAQKRGYDRNTAIGALSAGLQESGLNSTVRNASDHLGTFQEDAAKPGRDTAQGQIDWFFNQLDQLGGPGSQALKDNPLDTIASQIEKGGYGGAALAQHASAATQLYDQVLGKAGNVGVGPNAAFAGAQGYQDNPASRAKEAGTGQNVEQGVQAAGIAPLYTPGSTQVPQWMSDLASKFGLTASTYPSGGSLHQMGFAADFNGPVEMREAFAQYIKQNLSGQTLQLIYQGGTGQKYGIAAGQEVGPGTSQPGYYAGDFGGHTDHVHWATDVAPILGAGNASAASGQNDAVLNALRQNNTSLDEAIKIGQNPTATDQQVADSLQTIKQASIEQNQGTSPDAKQNAQALDSLANSISSDRGMAQTQDPIQSAAGVLSGASQVVGDVIGDINDTIKSIGATKNTADILVRGIANTQDVMKIIDNTQEWISTFAQYAQTVGDVASTIGQVVGAAGGADPTGGTGAAASAIQAVSAVADAVSGTLQGINEAIDIGQEIYQIWGSYYGQFLGFLTGGNNSLMGSVQYLLDQNTNQLLAYSTDNPMLKDAHPVPGALTRPNANNQAIGQLNYYAGPGTDAREATRQMMFQVKAAGYAGAITP